MSIVHTREQFPHFVHLCVSFLSWRKPILSKREIKALMGQYLHTNRFVTKAPMIQMLTNVIARKDKVIFTPLEKSMKNWLKLPSKMGINGLAGQIWQKLFIKSRQTWVGNRWLAIPKGIKKINKIRIIYLIDFNLSCIFQEYDEYSILNALLSLVNRSCTNPKGQTHPHQALFRKIANTMKRTIYFNRRIAL